MNSYLNIIDPASACPEFDTLQLPREYPYPLDPFQKHAVCAIQRNANVLVTAKTGSGKTMVGEHLIAKVLAEGKRVFYTTPIKSLSNQKFHDLKQMYPSVGILTGDIKYRPDAQIIIMTTEILRNLLYKENTPTRSLGSTALISMDNLGGVVFDECHYINDRERGKVWEETLILLPPSVQLVLLSATIDKPELFAGWLGALKQVPIYLISTSYRIVPLKHHVMLGEQPQLLMDNKEIFYADAYTRWLQWRDGKRRDARTHQNAVAARRVGGFEDPVVKGVGSMPSYIHQLNTMVDYLSAKEQLPALFFVFSRKDCELYANKITSNLLTSSETASIRHIWNFHLHRFGDDLRTLPQANDLFALLEKGIAFHHSGLLPVLREIVEILFGKGLIKLLFATETFAVGINMPTKTVVFTDVRKYSDEESSLRRLRTDEYIQMAGRAGRRGKDTEGYVYYLPVSEVLSCQEMKDMMCGRRSPITSRMDFHYEFILKTLQNQFLQWKDILGNSYWKQQRDEDIQQLKKDMQEKKDAMKALGLSDEMIGEFTDRRDLEYKTKTSVNAEKKRAQAALETWKNKHVGPQWENGWKVYQIWLDHDRRWALLRDDLEIVEDICRPVETKIKLLQECGYLNEDGNPTLLGTLATEVNEGHSLLLSAMYTSGRCKDFSAEELICFLAAFLGEANKKQDRVSLSDLAVSEQVNKALEEVDNRAYDFVELERSYRCSSPEGYWDLSLEWVSLAQRWYQGEEAAVLCSEYNVYMGNFIRAMLKLANLVEEWVNMATYCQHTELLSRYEGLKETLVRGLAKPDSLYLLL